MRWSILISLVLSIGLFCETAHSQIVSRILNGVETDDFESVGIVGSMELGGYCSGTLITPRHVLTAAHCAELTVSDTDGTFILDGTVYMTSRIVIHPDYDSETLDNDIAIYVLSEDVADVEPAELFRDEPLVGDLLTIVGFGGAGSGADGDDGTFGTKRVGTIMIDVVTDTLVSWEFDSEDESNTAPGDSGGPNFLEVDGVFYVAGITSGGSEEDAGLGDIAFNTRVDAFQVWIDETIDAGIDPPVEDPPTEDPPAEDPPTEEEPGEEGCHGGNGHGHGHGHGHHHGFGLGFLFGFGFGDFFTQLNDYFVETYDQTLGEWWGGVLDEVFGSTEEPAEEEPAVEEPGAEDPGGIAPSPGEETPTEESPTEENLGEEPPAEEDPGDELPDFEVPGSGELPGAGEGELPAGGGAPATGGAPIDVSGGTNRAVNRLRRIPQRAGRFAPRFIR